MRGYLQEAGASVARHAACRMVAQHAPPGRAALRPRLRAGASSVRRRWLPPESRATAVLYSRPASLFHLVGPDTTTRTS